MPWLPEGRTRLPLVVPGRLSSRPVRIPLVQFLLDQPARPAADFSNDLLHLVDAGAVRFGKVLQLMRLAADQIAVHRILGIVLHLRTPFLGVPVAFGEELPKGFRRFGRLLLCAATSLGSCLNVLFREDLGGLP